MFAIHHHHNNEEKEEEENSGGGGSPARSVVIDIEAMVDREVAR